MLGLMLQRLFQGRRRAEKRANSDATRDLMIAEVEHMIGVITCASPFFFDIRGPGTDSDILVREWASRARDEWLGTFVGLVTHPPEGAEKHGGWWEDAIAQMLGAWAQRKPEIVLPQIGPLLTDAETRAVALKVFALALVEYPTWRADFSQFMEQCAPWLTPVLQEQSHLVLTEREAWDIEDIQGCIRQRAEASSL